MGVCAEEVCVQAADFDAGLELAALRGNTGEVGALVSFVGVVRGGEAEEGIQSLELEHYPGMTESSIAAIIAEARQRWPLQGVRVIHRIGLLLPGEQIVLVAVAAGHRGEAFAAAEFIMDYLKTRAPFWKRERTPDGARWVDARCSDDQAARRWG